MRCRCMKEFPGGECDEPTGLRNCTFHVEDAGSVSLDELTGLNSSPPARTARFSSFIL